VRVARILAAVQCGRRSPAEGVAAIFIAQVYGIDLTFADQILVAVTALLASIGAASVPMSGMVMMFVILNAVAPETTNSGGEKDEAYFRWPAEYGTYYLVAAEMSSLTASTNGETLTVQIIKNGFCCAVSTP